MSYCPLDATSGFIQLTGPIPPHALQQISQNRYPIQTSFTPRTTPASLSNFHIADTSNNICFYRNKKYTLVDIQICQPLHTGYTLPGVTEQSSAEMILSFTGSDDPNGLLISLPIFNTGAVKNDEYLSQVIHQPNVTKITTLDMMMNQTSFGYRTCFEMVNGSGKVTPTSLYILVFPDGIHLSNSNYTLLTNGTVPRFGIPPALRNAEQTVQRYTITDGAKKSTLVSSDGFVYTIPISTCDTDFLNKIEYFLQPPPIKSESSTKVVASCGSTPLYQPSQYKCVPFDQNKNLNEQNGLIYVTPGTSNQTLQQLITKPNKPIQDTTIGGYSIVELETIIGASVVGIVVSIIVGVAAYQFAKDD